MRVSYSKLPALQGTADRYGDSKPGMKTRVWFGKHNPMHARSVVGCYGATVPEGGVWWILIWPIKWRW